MAQKYYVVWVGHKPGIYDNWSDTQKQVHRFKGARFKSFGDYETALSQWTLGIDETAKKGKQADKKQAKFKSPSVFDIQIFTDGGCFTNPGPSASGICVFQSERLELLRYGGYVENGSNNIAELSAILYALNLAKEYAQQGLRVGIYSDSKYSIQCVTEWAKNWRKNNWIKSDGKAVSNQEIIEQAYILFNEIKDSVGIFKVKGHSGLLGNELADHMATHAVRAKQIEWQDYDVNLLDDIGIDIDIAQPFDSLANGPLR